MTEEKNNQIDSDEDVKNDSMSSETDRDKKKEAKKNPADRTEELEEKYETATEEAKQTYDRFLRISAEFENYKKRKTREMSDFRKFANESLLKELIPVVDNLERAIDSFEKEKKGNEALIQGILMILREFMKVLEKFSVKPLESIGKPFDPCFHQAVFQEENAEYPDGTVSSEIQKGYMLQDRLLRPAMVVVSRSAEKDERKKKVSKNNS